MAQTNPIISVLVFWTVIASSAIVSSVIAANNTLQVNADDGAFLLSAVKTGELFKVKELISSGVDINWQDTEGLSPLYLACHDSKIDIVMTLVVGGANPNVSINTGDTPLHAATRANSVKIVYALLAAGANPDIPSNDGWTPVASAAHHGFLSIVQALVSSGANVSVENENGENALHHALKNNQLQIAQQLLVPIDHTCPNTPKLGVGYTGDELTVGFERYKIIETKQTWEEAKKACENEDNYQLAQPDNSSKIDYLINYLSLSYGNIIYFWVGGQGKGGSITWVNGGATIDTEQFRDDSPPDGSNVCVFFTNDGRPKPLNLLLCSTMNFAVTLCEYKQP